MTILFLALCTLMLTASIALCVVTIRKARQCQQQIDDYHDLYRENLDLKIALGVERGEIRF